MDATEGTALLRLIEQRIEAQVGPLRARIAELEAEVKRVKSRDPERPGLLQRLADALPGGAR